MLYFIPTPIGNLEDITLRAIRLFKELTILICEDTRSTKKLLKFLEIDYQNKTFHSLTSFTKAHQLEHYVSLLSSHDIGMVSDAGTPGLSDPGKELVRLCHVHNISFTVLPGPSALIPAVIGSGFDTSEFRFVGFLPKKKGKQTMIKNIITSPIPVFFYESVHRIEKTLLLFQELGYIGKVSIAREISKMYEQLVSGTLEEIIMLLQSGSITLKGEFVVGISPTN